MIKIYGTSIKNNKKSDFTELLSLLSEEKKVKVSQFIHVEDALRTLKGEWLLRTVISKELNIPFKEISIMTDNYGKPYLLNKKDFYFNISHSGQWVVCALDTEPVGIDVELMLPVDFGIAEQFFSTDEQKRLFSRGDKEKLPFFYELWTVKESFIKTVGKGLSIPLNSFSVNFEERKIDFLEYSKENYYFKQYNIDDNYKMAVSGMYCSFSDDIIMFGQ